MKQSAFFRKGVASAQDIDLAMQYGAIIPWVHWLCRLIGLDVVLNIMEVLQSETVSQV
jgi:3-hydroxyacyl-CoA dehydrogenase